MEIRQSAEDYLESILVLSKKGGGVRSIDIATRLGVSKPSVSHAMKLLREDGYIAMDRYGTVTLLEKGAEIANQIYERHIVLAGWVLLDQKLSIKELLGCVIMFAAIILAQLPEKENK